MEDSRRHAPLEGNYWLTALFVALALLPDLLVSSGLQLAQPSVAQSLHASRATLALGETLSNAGWAFGAVLASFLAMRYPGYILNFIYLGALIMGSLAGALAPAALWVVAGRVLQGTATGMLLVSTLPPLIRSFPENRLRLTAIIVDIAFFGAVAAGPIVGGYVAQVGAWRALFALAALMGAASFLLVALVAPRSPGFNPQFRFDALAVALAAVGALLTFYGVGAIQGSSWRSPQVWLPTALGLLCIATLIVNQYRRDQDALMPIKPLTTTYPLMGILTGIVGGLAYTALSGALLLALLDGHHMTPLGVGLVFWPALALALLAAGLFGLLFPTRYALLLPALGLLTLIAGATLALFAPISGGLGVYLAITALIGMGASLTVAPGLFMASLSVQPQLVGRAFALVELLRLAGAYAFAPAFAALAISQGAQGQALAGGARLAYTVTLAILLLTLVVATAIFFLGGARIHAPNLRAYLKENQAALDSPPVANNPARPSPGETLAAAMRSAIEPLGADGSQDGSQDESQDGSRGDLRAGERRGRDEERPQPTGPRAST